MERKERVKKRETEKKDQVNDGKRGGAEKK